MKWNSKKIKTMGDLSNAIYSCKTKQKANEFKTKYLSENKYALQNIGYLIGYMDADGREKYYNLFELSHPLINTPL
jgi:hypothetical protein